MRTAGVKVGAATHEEVLLAARGTNTCSVAASDPHVDGGCSITQGFDAKAKYTVGFGR